MKITIPILPRQVSNDGSLDDGDDSTGGWWWYSPTAYAIKWSIVAAIFLLFGLYIIGGYLHARRRMKRGLMPLPYHKFIVPRRQREQFLRNNPQYQGRIWNTRVVYASRQPFPMAPYGPPPPAYNEPEFVPAYSPPEGGSKTDPNQTYAPPSGPPPTGAAEASSSSSGAPEVSGNAPVYPPRTFKPFSR